MDPWLSSDSGSKEETTTLKFEDNFEPSDRLPDSVQYLASLEKKLARLKEKQSKKDLVQSLEEKHKSCMLRLVSEGNNTSVTQEDLDLDAPISSSHPAHALLRHIAPERQAITLGELVELLKADQLAEILAEDSKDSDTNSSN
ncbi:hypothetical protein ANN_06404 [Periplaneta americana]|uniref:Uncharacterized protein n=2 Tax=Periplaneta americana TaxID=6978 RepID=A0ABQ8TEC2_PERAM|nr:hypothetical protein ANN_06404 [Periplaneta americana]